MSEDNKQTRTWNMLCHLSVLAGFVIPFGNLLGPLLVWQIKKNGIPSVIFHGKSALNFQITMFLILFFAGFVLAIFVPAFPNLHLNYLGFPILILFCLFSFIFPIVAGLKANDGKDYKYPFSFNLLK